MKILIGLGNPGSRFDRTRHNIGFEFLNFIQEKWGIQEFKKSRFEGEISKLNAQKSCLLFKPMNYMNNSGQPIQKLLSYYRIDPVDVCVVYDDVSMKFGKVRFRSQGSSGRHNGIRSIIQYLSTQQFPRVKIGVGYDIRYNLSDWVLAKFLHKESEKIQSEIFPQVENILTQTFF